MRSKKLMLTLDSQTIRTAWSQRLAHPPTRRNGFLSLHSPPIILVVPLLFTALFLRQFRFRFLSGPPTGVTKHAGAGAYLVLFVWIGNAFGIEEFLIIEGSGFNFRLF